MGGINHVLLTELRNVIGKLSSLSQTESPFTLSTYKLFNYFTSIKLACSGDLVFHYMSSQLLLVSFFFLFLLISWFDWLMNRWLCNLYPKDWLIKFVNITSWLQIDVNTMFPGFWLFLVISMSAVIFILWYKRWHVISFYN